MSKEDIYSLATEALSAVARLEDGLSRERGFTWPTKSDLDIVQFIGTARFALMNAQALIHDRQKDGDEQ